MYDHAHDDVATAGAFAPAAPRRRVRSALLLDFDNVAASLRGFDPAIARRFWNEPGRWLEALAAGRLLPLPGGAAEERAFVALRCYANPEFGLWQATRINFLRAGFSVIDCPALTSQGKNSADMEMALDAVDLLRAEVPVDEFLLLSSDADFAPLLTRLRLHDRRTAILDNGATAAAYRSVAGATLTMAELVATFRGAGAATPGRTSRPKVPPAPPRTIDAALAGTMAGAVRALVEAADAPVPAASAASAAIRAAGGDHRAWAGYQRFSELVAGELGEAVAWRDNTLCRGAAPAEAAPAQTSA